MTWKSAFLIGDCTVEVALNGEVQTDAQLAAAGITLKIEDGVIILETEGLATPGMPYAVALKPSYDISKMASRMSNLLCGGRQNDLAFTCVAECDGSAQALTEVESGTAINLTPDPVVFDAGVAKTMLAMGYALLQS